MISLSAQGDALLAGASLTDYSVSMGDAECVMDHILENRLYCKPPRKEPKVVKEGAYKSGEPRVTVSLFTSPIAYRIHVQKVFPV